MLDWVETQGNQLPFGFFLDLSRRVVKNYQIQGGTSLMVNKSLGAGDKK